MTLQSCLCELIFVKHTALIRDNLLIRKYYFNSNIIQNENATWLPHFLKDNFEGVISR